MGGSFDPVHFEHINMVRSAMEKFDLDKVVIVPACVPPHKIGRTILDFSHRYQMLKLAFSPDENVEISDFEQKQGGISYTYLTMEHFSKVYKNAELFFLVGTDMLMDFPTWKNTGRILELATLMVTVRDGENYKKSLDFYLNSCNKPIVLSPYRGKNLSSTKIKCYKKLNLSIEEFTPKSVVDYIYGNSLYEADRYYGFVAKNLPEKRRRHTANVIVKAISLAKKLGVDADKAETAALLHDVAKYRKVEEYPEFSLPGGVPQPVVHQFLGAFIAKKELGICDDDVLNAIKYHTTGRKNMSALEKIVFIADLIEEDRDFDGVDSIREAIEDDFDKGFAFALSELNKFLSKSGDPVYYLTVECRDFYNHKR